MQPVVINVKAFEEMISTLKSINDNLRQFEQNYKTREQYQYAYAMSKNRHHISGIETRIKTFISEINGLRDK